MDDYMFDTVVAQSRAVYEPSTSYLEIYSYSDKTYDSVEEHPLTPDEFQNFLKREGAFAPRKAPQDPSVTLLACVRMILQKDAQHADTFAPQVISLSKDQYKSMIKTLNLPYRAIESSSAVGPFFWSAYDQDEVTPHLQIVFRKSDVVKKGMTRGWELMLSHDVKNGLTTGYCKGTPSSDIVQSIMHLKQCVSQIGHPMLLPIIIFSHDISFKTDIKQRAAREWLRKLENAISMRTDIEEDKEGHAWALDMDAVNRDLVECHSQVLWKRPVSYLKLLEDMGRAMQYFSDGLPDHRRIVIKGAHQSFTARMDFEKVRMQGLDSYAYTTLQRLEMQRSALYNIIAQKESKLNFQMAGEQRKLAHASKRDSEAMKTISLLGAIFFPGAYLASVFSMTFFNFQTDATVSSSFYIYWVVTIPVTVAVVLGWYVWEKRRDRQYEQVDRDLEQGSEEMELQIMAKMRKRTMSKVNTWDPRQKKER